MNAMKNMTWTGRQGFTLIELMMAMVVLTVGLFAIIHLQVVAVRGNSYARERTEAYQVAMAVEEEMRQRALSWQEDRNGAGPDFATVFPNIHLSPAPNQGEDISINELFALRTYNGYAISPDDNPQSALAVNIYGRSPSTDADLFGARAIYRINYTAHQVEFVPGAGPSPNLVRMTVYVSWDNKDHGKQDADWGGSWFDADHFFERHMVSATFYLRRMQQF